jgi:hypothetical protein
MRRQRSYITHRVAYAGRRPVCPFLSAFSMKQGRHLTAIRNNFQKVLNCCEALYLPGSNASPKSFLDLALQRNQVSLR